jgi:hypothetical protein
VREREMRERERNRQLWAWTEKCGHAGERDAAMRERERERERCGCGHAGDACGWVGGEGIRRAWLGKTVRGGGGIECRWIRWAGLF